MRLSPEPPAAGAKRELTDADRARIDARMARFGVAQEFAQAGLVVGEDYRKVAQLYEQLSAQAGSRGEALPAMDVWLQQRAQERLAQGYLPTLPEGGAVQPFEAAMNEGPASPPEAAARPQRICPGAARPRQQSCRLTRRVARLRSRACLASWDSASSCGKWRPRPPAVQARRRRSTRTRCPVCRASPRMRPPLTTRSAPQAPNPSASRPRRSKRWLSLSLATRSTAAMQIRSSTRSPTPARVGATADPALTACAPQPFGRSRKALLPLPPARLVLCLSCARQRRQDTVRREVPNGGRCSGVLLPRLGPGANAVPTGSVMRWRHPGASMPRPHQGQRALLLR